MGFGFISFPILTRIFSVGDYGILSLITTSVFIISAIVKFGFPKSIIRFYSESKGKNQLNLFYSTFFLSSTAIAVATGLLIIFVVHLILRKSFDNNIVKVLYFLPMIIFVTCVSDTFTSFLRAEERTKYYNLIGMFARFLSLGLSIFFTVYIVRGLVGYYLGLVISSVTVSTILFFTFFKKLEFSKKGFSIALFKSSFKFGFPLIWSEFSHLLLNYVDRYFIQFYLGATAVGLYSAGYSLGTYVTEGIVYPISYAMAPIYMRLLFEKGEEETKAFISNTYRYYVLIAFPAAFGFMGLGKDLLVVLATDKYSGAGVILPYVIVGQLIHYSTLILDVGLMIRKKTYIFPIVTMLSVLLNCLLNVVLLPRFGILGAAVATILSYLFYGGVIVYYSFREFRFSIDWSSIILYLSASLAMLVVIKNIDLGGQIVNLVGRIGIGAMIYFLLIFFFDKKIRCYVISLAKHMRKKYGWNYSRGF